jgi:hypothetical protein
MEYRNPDPGWYPDPSGRALERWWDGNAWVRSDAALYRPYDGPYDRRAHLHADGCRRWP